MSIDRRQHARSAVDWPARVGGRGLGIAPARIKDASIGGVYLETTLAVEVGTQVLLEMKMPAGDDKQPVLAEGKIMRAAVIDQRRRGYGIQFTRLEDKAMQQLLEVIAQLRSQS